jgi:hypothetical protein
MRPNSTKGKGNPKASFALLRCGAEAIHGRLSMVAMVSHRVSVFSLTHLSTPTPTTPSCHDSDMLTPQGFVIITNNRHSIPCPYPAHHDHHRALIAHLPYTNPSSVYRTASDGDGCVMVVC